MFAHIRHSFLSILSPAPEKSHASLGTQSLNLLSILVKITNILFLTDILMFSYHLFCPERHKNMVKEVQSGILEVWPIIYSLHILFLSNNAFKHPSVDYICLSLHRVVGAGAYFHSTLNMSPVCHRVVIEYVCGKKKEKFKI